LEKGGEMITYERKKVRYFQQLAESFDSAAANMEILDKIHQVLLHERSEAEMEAGFLSENGEHTGMSENEIAIKFSAARATFELADKILKLHWEEK
jgi:hypothetical protein